MITTIRFNSYKLIKWNLCDEIFSPFIILREAQLIHEVVHFSPAIYSRHSTHNSYLFVQVSFPQSTSEQSVIKCVLTWDATKGVYESDRRTCLNDSYILPLRVHFTWRHNIQIGFVLCLTMLCVCADIHETFNVKYRYKHIYNMPS